MSYGLPNASRPPYYFEMATAWRETDACGARGLDSAIDGIDENIVVVSSRLPHSITA